MYKVIYDNNYSTWIEARSSHWIKTHKETQEFLDNLHLKTKCAENIKIRKLVDVTEEFAIPNFEVKNIGLKVLTGGMKRDECI